MRSRLAQQSLTERFMMQMNRTRMTVLIGLWMLLLTACGASAEPEAAVSVDPPATATPSEEAQEPADDGVVTFVIDSAESNAAYIVDEEFFEDALTKFGIDPGDKVIRGQTEDVAGQLQLDLNNPQTLLGNNQFTVNMTALETDQSRRDTWIRENRNGPNFASFPESSFVVTSLSGLPDSIATETELAFQMTGDLTVRDITQSITFDVTATLTGDVLTATALVTDVLMSDFGIEPPDFFNTLTVADPFDIEVNITARAQ